MSQEQKLSVILSVDIGKTMGIAVNYDGDFIHKEEYIFNGYSLFYKKLNSLRALFKINLILIPYPTRFYYIIQFHAKLMGIVCLLAEKRDITVIEVQDATCKKIVLGDGRAKKEKIMRHFKEKNPHVADAMLSTNTVPPNTRTEPCLMLST